MSETPSDTNAFSYSPISEPDSPTPPPEGHAGPMYVSPEYRWESDGLTPPPGEYSPNPGASGVPPFSPGGPDLTAYGMNSPFAFNTTGMPPAPPGVGYGPGYYPPTLAEHPSANAVLALGILSLFFLILGPFAIWQGNRVRSEVAQGMYRSNGVATAGWVLGIFTTSMLAIIVLLVMLSILSLFSLNG